MFNYQCTYVAALNIITIRLVPVYDDADTLLVTFSAQPSTVSMRRPLLKLTDAEPTLVVAVGAAKSQAMMDRSRSLVDKYSKKSV